MKINKTNVARLLDKAKIAYQLVPYEVDENDLSATHVAEQLGENVEQVFKTLILHGDKSGYFVCVIPGADEVDLKKAFLRQQRLHPLHISFHRSCLSENPLSSLCYRLSSNRLCPNRHDTKSI